ATGPWAVPPDLGHLGGGHTLPGSPPRWPRPLSVGRSAPTKPGRPAASARSPYGIVQTVILWVRPRTSCSPTICSSTLPSRIATLVESATNTWWPEPLVIPSRRAAVLVVSPIAVYSIRRSDPTCPDITVPLLMPIPIAKPLPRPSPA